MLEDMGAGVVLPVTDMLLSAAERTVMTLCSKECFGYCFTLWS